MPYESSVDGEHPNTPGAPRTMVPPPGRVRPILRIQYPNLGQTPRTDRVENVVAKASPPIITSKPTTQRRESLNRSVMFISFLSPCHIASVLPTATHAGDFRLG